MADYIKTHTYRGVDGAVDMNNEYQAALHYPLQTDDLNKGMAQLYFQVQDGQHKIIQPYRAGRVEIPRLPLGLIDA